VHYGVLPDLDRQLLDFEAWLTRRLHGLGKHPHERLLRQFGLWHQLPRMRMKAALAPLTPPARTYAQLSSPPPQRSAPGSPSTGTARPSSARSTSTATTPR
jgi:hypothetical protein